MNIFNKTVYNKDLSIKYNQFFLMRFLLTRFSFLTLIVIGASIYLYYINMSKYILALFGLLAFNLLVLLLMNLISSSKIAKQYQENEVAMEYMFKEESFVVSEISASTDKEVMYSDLRKVIYTKNFILGYFKKSPIPMIIDNAGFMHPTDAKVLFTFLLSKTKAK